MIIMYLWNQVIRTLTIFGETCIINTLALSKLNYCVSILISPYDVIKKTYSAIYGFIWQKGDRIKRNTLIGKIEKVNRHG